MKTPHLLLAGNPRKIINNLKGLVEVGAISALEQEVDRNVRQMIALGRSYLRFAQGQPKGPYWRQVVSRSYYAAYFTSRAVRLYVDGHYTTDSSDHQKIGTLPKDFPSVNEYSVVFPVLREDRNICDYDHTATAKDLTYKSSETLSRVNRFLKDATLYLRSLGCRI